MRASHDRLNETLDAVMADTPVMHFAVTADSGRVFSEMARFAVTDDNARLFWLSACGGVMAQHVQRYARQDAYAPLNGSTHAAGNTLRFFGHAERVRTAARIEIGTALLVGRGVCTDVQIDNMMHAPFGSEAPVHDMYVADVESWQVGDSQLLYPARTESLRIRS